MVDDGDSKFMVGNVGRQGGYNGRVDTRLLKRLHMLFCKSGFNPWWLKTTGVKIDLHLHLVVGRDWCNWRYEWISCFGRQ